LRFQAAVLREAGLARPYAQTRPLAIETVEVPPPAAGEVLVQIKAASLCHSDLSVLNGDRTWPVPIVPGHEAAGVVAEVGAGVDSVVPGERVALIYLTQCGACARCLEGKAWLCERGTQANREGRLLTGGPRLSLGGEPVHHHMGLAAFAQYALVSERSLVRLPPELDFVTGSVFGCAVLCGAGSALHTAGIRPGQSVAVFGLGGVGLAAVLGAVTAGAARVVAVDPRGEKLSLAAQLGATDTLLAVTGDEVGSVAAAVRTLVHGGVDCALDATSTAAGFVEALEATRRGGTTVTMSLPHPSQRFELPVARLVAESRTIKGSYIGSCVPSRDIPAFLALHRQGRLPVEKLVSRTIALEEINAAFDALADASVVRQVIVF
jgi:alcohol dehydrogenase